MIVREWLHQAQERLSASPSPEVDARLLLEHLLGSPLDRSAVVPINEAEALLIRRESGEPVQYITGEAPFRYLVLQVGPGTLIPRPETELLVDEALKLIAGRQMRVADFGAGAGPISISIATESPADVVAVEKDPGAFAWLEKNVANFAPDIELHLSDVSDFDGGDFDLIVANPPYVPDDAAVPSEVVDFEPATAIFGGPDGSDLPKTFLRAAARSLKSGGVLIMEHSDSHQETIMKLASEHFVEVAPHLDLLGRPRYITARKP